MTCSKPINYKQLDATLEGVYRTPKTSLVSTGLSFVLQRDEAKIVAM